MILDGRDVLWLRYMESWLSFEPSSDPTRVLVRNIYGTRRPDRRHIRMLKTSYRGGRFAFHQ